MKLPRLLSVVCCLLSAVSAREFMIDTTGTRTQWDPAVAFDGENFLVAWADFRAGQGDIYGARISPSGNMLDVVGFPIAAGPVEQRQPALAFDGTNYLVVWEDWNEYPFGIDVHCARVTPAGQVLDSPPIVISNAPGYQIMPAVAFDGTNYLVVWMDLRSASRDIYGARVTPAGQVLDSSGIIISDAPGTQTMPKVAFDGENYLAVWSDARNGPSPDIYGTRISPAGEVLDTAGIPIGVTPGGDKRPAVTFGGPNFLVVWDVDGEEVYCARVTPDGQVLDPPGIPVAVGYDIPAYPAVASDGSDYFVVWRQSVPGGTPFPCLFGAKVSPDGEVDSAMTLVVHNYSVQRPNAACGGGVTFVVYEGSTYIYQGKLYASDRVWGKFGPFPGVEEAKNAERGIRNAGATIVRGTLRVGSPPAADGSRLEMLDAAGRRVMQLTSGLNDVRHLTPGVYFVRSKSRRESVRVVLAK